MGPVGGPVITVAAVVFRDAEGRMLTVRKNGTEKFMLPGGKLEPGESAAQAAVREVAEELGVRLRLEELALLGEFDSDAANEPGHLLRSTVFTWTGEVSPDAAAEIAELRWASLAEIVEGAQFAPLTREHVVPALQPS
ncbi:ADP-ribose pyrophosphatase YjhB (NUDIX family) [Nocardioides albertanoniae]|uniref:ADP-ribose pyrophosphatase YjhB (NUDIX family) n=1 Tax=Nocardioides albertanoniae TaxID=1175486 RepID=A0A543A309_9ACTN|nr:NUDIX domain-containing protein [Nocardioides albertanoniae]TQL66846.1 ADP-ribose pyrophosphatase YjhB (NUDIX family) [Nocardioides albertanoniae]